MTAGTPASVSMRGSGSWAGRRQHDDAVGLAVAQVADQAGALLVGADHLQRQLDAGLAQHAHQAADDAAEIRVGEEPAHERVVVV